MGLQMSGVYFLDFHQNKQGMLLLPPKCKVSVGCYESREVQLAVVSALEESLYALALLALDLSALDGITVALDARKAACELQYLRTVQFHWRWAISRRRWN